LVQRWYLRSQAGKATPARHRVWYGEPLYTVGRDDGELLSTAPGKRSPYGAAAIVVVSVPVYVPARESAGMVRATPRS
jgi:hypothetical protein